MHIIAADVGGTKTRLAFVDAMRPRDVLYEKRYLSGEFDGFEPMLQTFIEDSRALGNGADASMADALTLALPGLVSDSSARLTNLPWTVEKKSLKDSFGIKNIYFMNDFQASAFGTAQLQENDRIVLNPGVINSDALKKNNTRVAVGAGTGLGVAWADDVYINSEAQNQAAYTHDTEGGLSIPRTTWCRRTNYSVEFSLIDGRMENRTSISYRKLYRLKTCRTNPFFYS